VVVTVDAADLTPDDRTLDLSAVLMAVANLAFAALQWLHYELPVAGAALVGISLMFLATPLVGRLGVPRMPWISMAILLGAGSVSYLRGGVILPVLSWVTLLPATAFLLGRPRAALGLAGILVVMVTLLYYLEQSGLAPERKPATVAGALIGATALMVALVVLGAATRRSLTNAQREHAAMERRLFQANKLEGIARLAGGVAHDFNNLLAVIGGRARVAQQQIGPDHPAAEDIDSILAATESGAGLTRRLLAIGREGEPGIRTVPTDLCALLDDAADLLRGGLPDDVVMHLEVPSGEVVIRADPQRIHQVTMNLAINARDAMPHGGQLDLRVRQVELEEALPARYGDVPAGAWVVLEVQDTGEGMTEDILDRMLEPFFTTKERDEGSGLGLAVVHGIVEGLGGRFDVESSPGEGTRVSIYLPPYAGPSTAPVPRKAGSSAPYDPIRILLVEDDLSVRKATQRLLRLDGHDVIPAGSGEEALVLLEQNEPDLLVTDVVMPEMSGPDLARRARTRRPGLGVIYLSGYAGDVLKDEDLAPDSVCFLQKPVSRELLNETITKLTRKRRL